VELIGGQAIIKNVWQTQLVNLDQDILEAEIMTFNGVDFNTAIESFPSQCHDKTLPRVRAWIANKIVSGKYSEPRILGLRLKNGDQINFDLDALKFKEGSGLLTTKVESGIGIIRLNNSLGNNRLISEFDKVLDGLMDTKGIILDLRNTNTGGNTYVAKGIMGRFISQELPYQKHEYIEQFDDQPAVVRSWLELVSPRGIQYTKPVVVLVGRWTGSMGEGMAIGLDAMNRAPIVGTEMKRLAGSDFDFTFKHQDFRFKIILEKLYHINGTPREEFLPENYVVQTTLIRDETLAIGMELIRSMTQ
jgi:carboxyl-terminal processing protease